ncbi:NHLP leader peptide family RiPP precursor [Azospirillum sp. B510]|uniref:NHLP leader peptide family RiPP precursor n=1 Tax=Azospirillum sp. (strain B510) TaxID=137722 RepID=UPI0002E8DA9A|nr:NHLP leader peptide family RiPP precursor [Azospirillum sp. B510]
MTNDTQTAPMTRRELEAKIVARAWSDDAFKAKFLADPKAMFEEHLGTKLPETLEITAHEETAEALHFVIPAKPRIDLDELSEEDLEKVAGGVDALATALVTITISIASMVGTAASAGGVTYLTAKGAKW